MNESNQPAAQNLLLTFNKDIHQFYVHKLSNIKITGMLVFYIKTGTPLGLKARVLDVLQCVRVQSIHRTHTNILCRQQKESFKKSDIHGHKQF